MEIGGERKMTFSRLWRCILYFKRSHITSGGSVWKLVCAEKRRHIARLQGERFSPMPFLLARVTMHETHGWSKRSLIGCLCPQVLITRDLLVDTCSYWVAAWESSNFMQKPKVFRGRVRKRLNCRVLFIRLVFCLTFTKSTLLLAFTY